MAAVTFACGLLSAVAPTFPVSGPASGHRLDAVSVSLALDSRWERMPQLCRRQPQASLPPRLTAPTNQMEQYRASFTLCLLHQLKAAFPFGCPPRRWWPPVPAWASACPVHQRSIRCSWSGCRSGRADAGSCSSTSGTILTQPATHRASKQNISNVCFLMHVFRCHSAADLSATTSKQPLRNHPSAGPFPQSHWQFECQPTMLKIQPITFRWTLGTALEVGLAWTVLNARGWRMLVGLSAIPFGTCVRTPTAPPVAR